MKYFKVVFFAGLFGLVLSSCSKKEQTIYDLIELDTRSKSLALLFTSSIIPPAGDFGLPVIDSMKNNLISGVDGNSFFYLSLYPQVSDPLWRPDAELFKFKYDANGDNTFTSFPGFAANTVNYNYDLEAFKNNLSAHAAFAPLASVGSAIKLVNGNLEIYIKIKYKEEYSKSHSVAVYVYEKTKTASQATINNGTVNDFIHKNVLLANVNSVDGELLVGTQAKDFERELQYNYPKPDFVEIGDLGVLTVVYEVDSDGKPAGVIHAASN